MLSTDLLLALASFAFVSSITPGPNNLMLMASGTNFGFVRTLPHMLGVALGFVLMLVLVGAGVAWIFEALPHAYTVLKVASAGYLIYLAYKIATAAPPSGGTETSRARPLTFTQAAAFQWVNPKAWTMALTAVGVYVPTEEAWLGLMVVAGVFGAVNLPSVGVWALLGAQMRRFLHHPRAMRVFNGAAAGLLIASLYPILAEGWTALSGQ